MISQGTIRQAVNKKFAPVFQSKARYIHLVGGRGRGGSFFGTDYFLHKITQPQYFRGYFMRQVFGDVRESLWRDFKDRLEENDTVDMRLFNLQENPMVAAYTPNNNTIISRGFKKTGQQTAKLKSIAGATHVLIEEAEETTEDDFTVLDDSLRTTKGDIQIIMIFNMPHKNHWIIKRWYNLIPAETVHGKDFEGYYIAIPKSDETLLSLFSTYHDNRKNINPSTAARWENYRHTNFEHYATMIKGLVSEGMKGLIFKKWKPVSNDYFNSLEYETFYGLDFGFSNDPAALIAIKRHNDDIWVKELLYERGMTNQMLSRRFGELGISPQAEIYADSAEPKSIEELNLEGWNVLASAKGQDSIRAGISFLLSKNIHYTEDSLNLINEKQGYRWALDANKEPTNKPVDDFNHLMDALRYGVFTKFSGGDTGLWSIGDDGGITKW